MSVSSVSSSSIYGQRNVLSGLASGMDTESMIENMTQATRLKIQQQKQKKTLLGWTQEAYRGISSKLIEFSQKYTDYQSDTNMLSPSFFTQSEITTSGKYADLISATGKTSSNIVINGVKQMATAATHSVKKFSNGSKIEGNFDFNGQTDLPTLNGGSMTFTYGDEDYTVYLGENVDYKNPDALEEALTKALESVEVNGGTLADKVKFTVSKGGNDQLGINLVSTDNNGNIVKLKEVSDNVKNVFGFDPGDNGIDLTTGGITESVDSKKLVETVTNKDTLAGKQIVISLNGKNATIQFPKASDTEAWKNGDSLIANLNDQLKKAFGDQKVEFKYEGTDKKTFSLSMVDKNPSDGNDPNDANILRINGGDTNALAVLGLKAGDGNRINMNQKLGDIEEYSNLFQEGKGTITINGKDIEVTSDMTMREMINAINNSDAGVTATYSELSDTLKLTAKETGTGHEIVIGDGQAGGDPNLAETIFGIDNGPDDSITNEDGQNAKIDVTVNGQTMKLERSSNDIEIDGLKIQIKGTFDNAAGNEVTFTSKPKTDEITEGVKSMIEDFNKMLQDVYKQMSTKPNKDYQPLTDEERDELSEEQIEKWEEKAKEGLLFGDSQLRTLHSELRTVFSPGGEMSKKLEKMGITFEWSVNSTDGGKIKFDEKAFRAALEENPDMVSEVFTTQESTDSSGNRIKGGIAVELKRIYEDYASTSIVQPGILVARAGSTYSANSLMKNTLQTEIDGIDKILNNLNTKLKTEIDRYNKQFTQLEMLVSQMNSQSSSLAGLMGGY